MNITDRFNCFTLCFALAFFLFPLLNFSSADTEESPKNRTYCRITYFDEADEKEFNILTRGCTKKFPFKQNNETELDDDKFFEENAENCFFNCVAEGLRVTKNGQLQLNEVKSYFAKTNATAKYVKTMTDEISTCSKSAETTLEKEGGVGKHICVYHVLLVKCLENRFPNIDDLDELCSQK